VDDGGACRDCKRCTAALHTAEARISELEGELCALRELFAENTQTTELLEAELKRYRYAYNVGQPNCPERVPRDQLQLAFERVLAYVPPANDLAGGGTGSLDEAEAAAAGSDASGTGPERSPPAKDKRNAGCQRGHGRRNPDLSNLPIESARVDPPEVTANPALFKCIGEETSSRVGYRAACYVRLILVRTKWVLITSKGAVPEAAAEMVAADAAPEAAAPDTTTVHIAPLPLSVLPHVMADPSAIANVIVSKYDDVLPLHRQERISARHGFTLPRSTQCGWLTVAFSLLYRIVLAMFDEAKAQAFCIATDATGAPVQKAGGCRRWHVFTFIADNGHIVFRWVNEHSGTAISNLLLGFRGHLLSDASPIYNVLYREFGIVPVYCWAHCRRYFFEAAICKYPIGIQGLLRIRAMYAADHAFRRMPPAKRKLMRAQHLRPLMESFFAWVKQARTAAQGRDLATKALGYAFNQEQQLLRVLEDGRLPLDNTRSERSLRKIVVGRKNWMFYGSDTHAESAAAIFSIIASCRLHAIDPEQYLDEILRLLPYWPQERYLELAPKHWKTTRVKLRADELAAPLGAFTIPAA